MERKAIIVMASQKNLPTAATIISYFDPATVGNLGLISIPCIVFYIMQLFIDSYIANTWSSKYERLAAVEASYTDQLQALETSDKVAAKISSADQATPGSVDAAEELIPAAKPVATGATHETLGRRPSRTLRLSARSSDDEAGLLHNIELNDVNPLLERH